MPADMKRYPSDWKNISIRIRERDGQQCKFCGVKNYQVIYRKPSSAEYLIALEDDGCMTPSGAYIMAEYLPDWVIEAPLTRVVLTVAHLGTAYPDGTPGNKHDKMDCRDENLAALCQRCHLLEDMDEHIANRKKTLRRKRIEAQRQYEQSSGQKSLFEVLP